MTLIKDQYQLLYGHRDINYAGVTTGKYVAHHGIRGREEATGLGVYYATRQILSNEVQLLKLGLESGLKGKKFIVQGFGNVGYWSSKFFTEEGAILVGVSEADGSIYCPQGLDPDALLTYKKKKRGIKGFLHSSSLEGKEYVKDDAIYHEWYKLFNSVTSSSLLPSNSPSTRTTPTGSSASWSLRQPTDQPPELVRRSCSRRESVSCPMSSATVEE